MKIHSKQITAYIDYLKQAGFSITLHGNLISNSMFLKYNYHQNPYCHYVKTVYGKWSQCVCRQDKVIDKAKGGSFFGCCYAGVGEFVYPIHVHDHIVGFVSVSGFFTDTTQAKLAHFAKQHDIPKDKLSNLAIKYLDAHIPQKSAVDVVIEPLIFMLEAYFSPSKEHCDEETLLYHKVLRYVTEHCHSRPTMQDLSKHFHYSVSTLSHLFLKNSGKSLPVYLNELRLSEAKWYLANSETEITEIAMFLGYSSSNYFSSVFKKTCGMTPKEYRKKMK